ncbi:MAG: hypothetical protein JWQ22_2207 [Devosia sp.]|nr:hypothetical protein [Devosia sp.]
MLNAMKTDFSELLNLSKDALHIHIGIGLYVIAMLAFRRGPGSWWPWLTVLGFELLNEAIDIFHHGFSHLEVSGSIKDLFNTMFWPSVVLTAARIQARRSRGPAAVSDSRAVNQT